MADGPEQYAANVAQQVVTWAGVLTAASEPHMTLLCREITRAADTREKRAALGKLAELLKQAWVGTL